MSRPRQDIERVLNEALEAIDAGDNPFPALSYSDGVQAALDWVLGNTDTEPMEP